MTWRLKWYKYIHAGDTEISNSNNLDNNEQWKKKEQRKIDQREKIAIHIHSSRRLNLHFPKNRRQIHPPSPTLIKVLIHTSRQRPQQRSVRRRPYNSRDEVCQAESQSQFDKLVKKKRPQTFNRTDSGIDGLLPIEEIGKIPKLGV